MARINIEDAIYSDVRFHALLAKCGGDSDRAIGAMVRAWSLAQAWYLNEETKRMIPCTEWKKQRICDLLIEVGLAEAQENLIYVCGSDDQFAWLIQKSEAGRKSGEARKKKNFDEHTLTDVKSRSTHVNGPEPLSPSLSPTLSQSLDPNTPLTPQGEDVGEFGDLKSAAEKSTSELCKNAQSARVRLDDAFQLYNEILAGVGKLRHVRDVGDRTRREFINSLTAFPSLDHWRELFEMVKKSKKLTGQVETTWLATFSWLAVKENALKVEQGAYDDDFSQVKRDRILGDLADLKLE